MEKGEAFGLRNSVHTGSSCASLLHQVNAHQVPKRRSTKKKKMKVSKKFAFPSVYYSEEPLELRLQLKHQSSDFCNRTKMFVPLMFPMKSSVVLADGGCGPIF